jgi:hypothetical protein
MVSDDDDDVGEELSKAAIRRKAEAQITAEIVEWTRKGETFRKIVRQQWNGASGRGKTIPFPLVARNVWDALDSSGRTQFAAQAKQAFVQMHMMKFKGLSVQARFAALGAVTTDPDSWDVAAEGDASPIVLLLESVVTNGENRNVSASESAPNDGGDAGKASRGIRYLLDNEARAASTKDETIALGHDPLRRLRGHENYRKLVVEWLLTLRSRWLCELAACVTSTVSFHAERVVAQETGPAASQGE